MKEIFMRRYREYGMKYFFKGLYPTLLRAFPVNAAVLASFDYISSYLERQKYKE